MNLLISCRGVAKWPDGPEARLSNSRLDLQENRKSDDLSCHGNNNEHVVSVTWFCLWGKYRSLSLISMLVTYKNWWYQSGFCWINGRWFSEQLAVGQMGSCSNRTLLGRLVFQNKETTAGTIWPPTRLPSFRTASYKQPGFVSLCWAELIQLVSALC